MRKLPVVQARDPFARPKTVGDCRDGIRPCPHVGCEFNLLIDVLEDGSLVLNTPSKRLTGADRTIPDEHEHERFWFVEVRIPARAAKRRDPRMKPGAPAIFMFGPLDSADAAKKLAAKWEEDSGPNTTRVHRSIPDTYQRVGPKMEGEIDAKFEDEAEDAIERWFDEPDPSIPSCLLDEIAKADRDRERDDDGHLLEQIARVMYVSRERIRQVESAALPKFADRLKQAGLSIADLHDED
jgi:hypothetical protein